MGGAGCRIAYKFFSSDHNNVTGVLIDTSLPDLSYLKYRYRIPAAEGLLGGEGTQKDLDLGMEVMEADRFSLSEKISRVKDDVDCFFVISALGGGTGGAAGILMEELKRSFIEPVYYIGLLPSKEDLSPIVINGARALREAIRHCDAFFPIDMDRLKTSTRLKGNFDSLNSRIFRYFSRVFNIGEFQGRGDIGENTVDFQDLVKTLKGLSVVGLGGQNLLEEPNADKPEAVITLTRKASMATTLPVVPDDVQRALVAVLGDRDYIDFLGSIPARLWVEKAIAGTEVRGGDMPLSGKGMVEVLVIYSDVKRSEEMATLYKKVEVLEKSRAMNESTSEIVERLGNMRGRLEELEREMDETYQILKRSLAGKDS